MTDEYLREYQFPITTAETPFLSAAETMTPTGGTPAEKDKTTATNVAENAAEHGAIRAATARSAETNEPHREMNAVTLSAKKGAKCAAPDSAARTAAIGSDQGERSAAARIAEAQREITTADAPDAVVKTRANADRTKGARKKAERKRTATVPPLPPAATGS